MIFGYRVILQPYFFQTDKGISAGVNIFSSSFKIGPKARQSIYIDAIYKRDDGFKIHWYIYTVCGRPCVYLEFVLLWEINERGRG
jgi:hypothetical protein